jgi:glycosyltransferase involved in cell wall biosynthesis
MRPSAGAWRLTFSFAISDPRGVREEFGISTRFIVIMVAAFSHFKDYDLFIDIAKEADGIRDDITFFAVGDGSDFNRIRKRVNDEKLGNVVLSGRQKNVEKLVAVSDIGLLCTKSEGISNSIIEYMAMGKPVIATDVIGGSRELMIDGATGYCTERNKDLIIELINRLLDNEGLRFSMGRLGKERIESKFSVGHMGEEFRSLYRDVMEEKKYRGSHLLEKPVKQ